MSDVVLVVASVGIRGDGIAHHDGERVFLPLTAPGDVVRARLGERRPDGRRAELLELLAAGARAAPRCPHFGACGGCALQHLDARAYADAKTAFLAAALRQHRVEADAVLPLRLLPPGTRRRARFAIRRKRPAVSPAEIGFHARASHDVVDMRACAVLHPALVALLDPLRALAPDLMAPGGAAAATATRAESGIDLLIDLAAPPALAALEAMASFAREQDLARLAWRTPSQTPVPVAQHRPARVVFAGVAVDLPYDAFLQASAEADRELAALVLAAAGTPRRIADLFAGIGTFAFALAGASRVHAVDGNAAAIAALAAAAARAGLGDRVACARRDLERRPLTPEELAGFDAAVFDPPRAGARAQAQALAASTVPRIVAVSCNPATFARDARTLIDGGYHLATVQPIDSFVWSPHLELVARFDRAAAPR
ncbi:MAG TPA: class I SAM-dependent RNA methyltransferase [Stellaceae bacterium]|nr:class I SAM-dependent RNA methyltransferase [Stellaceae bacterium]